MKKRNRNILIAILTTSILLSFCACDDDFWEEETESESSLFTNIETTAESSLQAENTSKDTSLETSDNNTGQSDQTASANTEEAIQANSNEVSAASEEVDLSNLAFLEANDLYGNPVTTESFRGAKLIMINFWEPWCGPCVREMPDLQKLYENYKDQGLLVLGVYATFSQDVDAKYIVESNGITYPILRCTDTLYQLEQDYVPCTYFVDNQGNMLLDEPVAGSQSYEEWSSLVEAYFTE